MSLSKFDRIYLSIINESKRNGLSSAEKVAKILGIDDLHDDDFVEFSEWLSDAPDDMDLNKRIDEFLES
jgi:hypothetical protein